MNTKSITILAVCGILLTSFLSCAAPTGRGGYETPAYEVVTKSGSFEVRDYPAVTVASAPMTDKNGNRNAAFMKLFRYISGQNEAEQKIKAESLALLKKVAKQRADERLVPSK